MGNHRAERGHRRTASAERARKTLSDRGAAPAGGRRAAAPAPRTSHTSQPVADVDVALPTRLPVAANQVSEKSVPLTEVATYPTTLPPAGGKRRATKHSGSRGPLFRGLPSLPVIAGAAALAVSIGGAVVGPGMASDPAVSADVARSNAVRQAAAVVADRDRVVSRDSRRAAVAEASDAELVAQAEAAAAARSKTLANLQAKANKQAAKIEANQWVMPVSGYRLSATFGLSSYLWSTVHTGLDFAAPSGTPLVAVANGTITEVGYDGSYGNKTVLTLEDGTEIWYCHQSTMDVFVGQTVAGGDVIGRVGSTGNSTGAHLHLEVRPGGADPVDPYSTLMNHGLRP